jgi:hypothetical protein
MNNEIKYGELSEIRMFTRPAQGNLEIYFTAFCPVHGRRVRCEVGPIENGHRVIWSCPSRYDRQYHGLLTSKNYTPPPTRETRLSVGTTPEHEVKRFMDDTNSTLTESKDACITRDFNH